MKIKASRQLSLQTNEWRSICRGRVGRCPRRGSPYSFQQGTAIPCSRARLRVHAACTSARGDAGAGARAHSDPPRSPRVTTGSRAQTQTHRNTHIRRRRTAAAKPKKPQGRSRDPPEKRGNGGEGGRAARREGGRAGPGLTARPLLRVQIDDDVAQTGLQEHRHGVSASDAGSASPGVSSATRRPRRLAGLAAPGRLRHRSATPAMTSPRDASLRHRPATPPLPVGAWPRLPRC